MSAETKIRYKSEEELKRQIDNVTTQIDNSISPPSMLDNIATYSTEDARGEFPLRYSVYVEQLRGRPTDERTLRRINALNNIDNYIHTFKNGEEVTLREQQITVFDDLRRMLEEGENYGYIKLPTGSGKTVIFTELVEAADLNTLIVVPTTVLVDQTGEKFDEFAHDIAVGKIYGYEKNAENNVTITTYTSFLSSVENNELNIEEVELLILDEVHKALSDRRMDAVRKFENSIVIGFTATPEYASNKKVSDLLQREIHSVNLIEATELGMTSPFSVYLVETNSDISNIRVSSTGDYSTDELEKAINTEERNEAARLIYEELFKDEKAIAYCTNIQHAEDMTNKFLQHGISAETINGDLTKKQKTEILERFRSGETSVLCNADLLIEGFDEASCNVCLNLRPTLSPIVAEQRGGRVLRLDPSNPEKHAYIVDFFDLNTREDKRPVSFADVAGGAYAMKKTSVREKNIGTTEDDKEKSSVKVEGINVVVNPTEVMSILRQRINEEIETSETERITPRDLKDMYNIPNTTFWKIETALLKKHPDEFSREKGKPLKATEKGIEILISELEKRKTSTRKVPEDYVKISLTELGSMYNVSHYTLIRILKRAIEEDLEIISSGLGSGVYYFASEKGLNDFIQLIQEHEKRPDEYEELKKQGFIEISLSKLQKEFPVRQIKFWRAVSDFTEQHSDKIVRTGGWRPTLITEEGLSILREMVLENS